MIMSYKCLKLKLRVFLAGHVVTDGDLICSYINHIEGNTFTNDWACHFVNTMIFASTDIEWSL